MKTLQKYSVGIFALGCLIVLLGGVSSGALSQHQQEYLQQLGAGIVVIGTAIGLGIAAREIYQKLNCREFPNRNIKISIWITILGGVFFLLGVCDVADFLEIAFPFGRALILIGVVMTVIVLFWESKRQEYSKRNVIVSTGNIVFGFLIFLMGFIDPDYLNYHFTESVIQLGGAITLIGIGTTAFVLYQNSKAKVSQHESASKSREAKPGVIWKTIIILVIVVCGIAFAIIPRSSHICEAAMYGRRVDVLRHLLFRANINGSRDADATPLTAAAISGRLDMVKFLVRLGARIDVLTSRTYSSPIIAAAEGGNLEIVQYLVKQGAQTKASDLRGATALIAAARMGHLDIVEYLVEGGDDINRKSFNGVTPLYHAALEGHLDVVKYLVEKGAEISVADKDGYTPLAGAALQGHLDVVQYLVEKGPNVVSTGGSVRIDGEALALPRMLAANGGHLNIVKYLDGKGANALTNSMPVGATLHMAAIEGHLDVVKYLVDNGASVNLKSSDLDKTPLYLAAENGHLDVVKYLIGRGAKVNVSDNAGVTPLMAATKNGHQDVVIYLGEISSNIINNNAGAKSNGELLVSAAINGEMADVINLVGSGADVNTEGRDGLTPLVGAALGGHMDAVKYLVDNGAVINPKRNDWIPLMGATVGGNLDIVKYLIDRGAELNASNVVGKTSLIIAATTGRLDVVKCLIEKGADVNIGDEHALGPLMFAASRGNLDVIKCLVENGAEINARDDTGSTPIMLAASEDKIEAVKYLAENGSNLDATDNNGWTALFWAAGV